MMHLDVPFWGASVVLGAWVGSVIALRALRVRRWVPAIIPALAATITLLVVSQASYESFARSAEPLTAFLGPAVVALAVPIHHHRRAIASVLPAVMISSALAVGAGVAVTLTLTAISGQEQDLRAAVLPMLATSPVAAEVADALGGPAPTAAILAIVCGLLGATLGPHLLRVGGVRDAKTIGFALGVSAHAIGTARAFDLSSETGAFAAVGMAFTAPMVAVTSVFTWFIIGVL